MCQYSKAAIAQKRSAQINCPHQHVIKTSQRSSQPGFPRALEKLIHTPTAAMTNIRTIATTDGSTFTTGFFELIPVKKPAKPVAQSLPA
jgi:hypothetical protein